jgi:NADPH:quinone reductase-like Zn-dependent oxidoreductase
MYFKTPMTPPQIPSNISFDEAASIPLGLATAALGLFGPRAEGLQSFIPPWSGGEGKYANQPIVIFGGSSSVGQYSKQCIMKANILGLTSFPRSHPIR